MVSESTCVAGLWGAISSQADFHLPVPAILAHAWFLDHAAVCFLAPCGTLPPDGLQLLKVTVITLGMSGPVCAHPIEGWVWNCSSDSSHSIWISQA